MNDFAVAVPAFLVGLLVGGILVLTFTGKKKTPVREIKHEHFVAARERKE
jgi:hypothetical protein